MTVYFIDISAYQPNINLSGWHAVCIKATEGTGWMNPYWSAQRGRAAAAGAFSFGYHFLHAGNGAGQADYYFSKVGKVPCMLDFEPSSSRPGVGDAIAFTDRLRSHGVPVNTMYLPGWYHQQLGSPGLSAFAQRKMVLWSSNYTSYSDGGPGWRAYGGMSPQIWQYTSTMNTGGYSQVDCNAYKGSFAQLQALVNGGGYSSPVAGQLVVADLRGKTAGAAHNWIAGAGLKPVAQAGQKPGQIVTGTTPGAGSGIGKGGAVQILAADAPTLSQGAKGTWPWLAQGDLNKTGAHLTQDGDFGPATASAVYTFQKNHGLGADRVIGPKTWAALGSL